MFWCAIAFVGGLSLYFQQSSVSLGYWVVILLLVGALSQRGPTLVRRAGWLALGVGYACLHTSLSYRPLATELEGVDLRVAGTVVGLPDRDSRRQRFEFRIDAINDLQSGTALPGAPLLARLSWYGEGAPLIASGQRLRIVVKLKRARGFANPGAFDYEKWLFARRIAATGYVRDRLFESRGALVASAGWRLMAWREWLRHRLLAATDGLSNNGVILALAIGDRAAIDRQQWRRYIDTGTNHLLAISGLHISLVAGSCGWLATLAWARMARTRRFARARCAAIAGLFAAFWYAAMAGFSLPTQRALIMLGVLAAALLWARHLNRSGGFALALIAVCLWDPRAVLGVGLWLSFSAVAILMIVFSGARRERSGARALAMARSHLLITLGLAPMTLLLFGQLSLVAPLANLIAVPVVGFIVVPCVFAGALLSVVSVAAASIVFALLDRVLASLGVLLDWLASWPLAVLASGEISATQWLFAIAAVALSLLPQHWRLRWLLLPLLLPSLFGGDGRPPDGEFEVTFLDVGQGTAVVVVTRHHALVYDTGPGYSARFNGASIGILPLLRSRQIDALDRLVISHPDQDHSGGAAHLLDNISVGAVYGSAPVLTLDVPMRDCASADAWRWDGVQFEFLAPAKRQRGSENDRSCVLAIRSAAGAGALLSGDIERDGERRLLARGVAPSQLLLAPHHGSDTSSGSDFIRALAPSHVVYTTGHANRYGFPHDQVQARYRRAGARQHNTASDGALTFTSVDGGFAWRAERQSRRRIWNQSAR